MKERATGDLRRIEYVHNLDDEQLSQVKTILNERIAANDGELELLWKESKRFELKQEDIQILLFELNAIRQQVGLPMVDVDELKILFLPDEPFDSAYALAGGGADRTVGGFVSSTTSYIVIRDETEGGYIHRMTGTFHELIHKFIDKEVHTYIFNGERATHHNSRYGLDVKYWERNNEGEWIKNKNRRGSFINEIGNHLGEYRMMRKLIAESELARDEFMESAVNFAEQTGESTIREQKKIWLQLGEVKLALNVDMIPYLLYQYFGKERTKLGPHSLLVQLSIDLERLVGDVDGKPFFEFLMESKMDPKLQNKLRVSVDEKMGQGFYEKMRGAFYGDPVETMELVQEIQAKL